MARFQFNVGQLLVITTIVAIIAAIIGWLDLPPGLSLALFWGYAFFLGSWLVVRGPAVITGLSDVQRRRRDLAKRRRDMMVEIQTQREALRSHPADAPNGAADRLH
jgi:hypothetical protein